MKITFSLFSKNKSLIGFEIEKSGTITRDKNDMPAFQKTVEVSIGFLFGYISLHFDLGSSVSLEKMITETNDFIKL